MLPLLAALQHADSAFPGGNFAFSNGLEGIAGLGTPLGRRGLTNVITGVVRHRWATADRIVLVRAHRAGADLDELADVDFACEAATLSEPLRIGSRRNGAALLAAHVRLSTEGAGVLQRRIGEGRALGHLPVMQGFVWRALGIPEDDAVAMSGYMTAAGLTAAAVRLGRIGALEAQAVLRDVLPVIVEESASVVMPDEEIRSFLPWIDVAAARHVRAPLRLFAN